jgi:inorganic triphosphatase YgiF
METELKFTLSPQRQRKIETLLAKLSRSMSGPISRHEVTRYFDFADLSLFRHGFALRTRESAGGYVQTLKSLYGGGAALARFEREWVLARGRLDVTRLAGTPVSRLMAARREAPIREVFATDILRVTYSLALDDNAIVELAIDNGHVRSGEKAEAIHEIEIELKAGDTAPLYRFASALHESCPLTISSDSKAARGYRLAGGGRFQPRKTDDIELPGNVSIAEGFRRILDSGLGQLVANLPFCSVHDPEPLHQSRIAIRRMRSALALFDSYLEPDAAGRFEVMLKRFGQILGAARDRDVFLEEVAARKEEDRENAAWLDMVIPPLKGERRDAYRGVQALIRSAQPTSFALALSGWAESGLCLRKFKDLANRPLADIVPDMLDRLAGKAHKRGGHLKDCSLDELHSLRKALKKLRYCTEYCETLYKRKRVKRYQERAKGLLDVLGVLNDTVGTETLLDRLNTRDAALTAGISALSRSAMAEREKAMKALPKAWKVFEAEKPFWR